MKKILVILFLIIFTIQLVSAEELPKPGALPDSPFYSFKKFGERIRLWLTSDSEARVRLRLQIAEMRLAELNATISKGLYTYIERLRYEYENEIGKAEEELNGSKAFGRNVTLLAEHVSNVTYKHILVLERVLEKVPEQAKPAIEHAINVSIRGHEQAVESILGRINKTIEKVERKNCTIDDDCKGLFCPQVLGSDTPVCEDGKCKCGGKTRECLNYYSCPDETKVPWCTYENGRCVCIISPEVQCPEVSLVLNEVYRLNESIEIKVKNSGYSSVYYDASGCGPKTMSYKILSGTNELTLINSCFACTTQLKIEEIKSGETKTIDVWNQKIYGKLGTCNCSMDPTCDEKYINGGEYTINFTYNAQNNTWPLPKETSKTISKTINVVATNQSCNVSLSGLDCPVNMKCENSICVDVGCVGEGNMTPGPISPEYRKHMAAKCCEGLKEIMYSGYFDKNCNPVPLAGAGNVCSNCGNGICEAWETKCTCKEDCGETILITATTQPAPKRQVGQDITVTGVVKKINKKMYNVEVTIEVTEGNGTSSNQTVNVGDSILVKLSGVGSVRNWKSYLLKREDAISLKIHFAENSYWEAFDENLSYV